MNCSHHMWNDPTAPLCSRTDRHDEGATGGHVYESGDGSFVNAAEQADAFS